MQEISVTMDPDVKRVCDFIQYGPDGVSGVAAEKRIAVARVVASLAEVLWGAQPQGAFYDPPLCISRAIRVPVKD